MLLELKILFCIASPWISNNKGWSSKNPWVREDCQKELEMLLWRNNSQRLQWITQRPWGLQMVLRYTHTKLKVFSTPSATTARHFFSTWSLKNWRGDLSAVSWMTIIYNPICPGCKYVFYSINYIYFIGILRDTGSDSAVFFNAI